MNHHQWTSGTPRRHERPVGLRLPLAGFLLTLTAPPLNGQSLQDPGKEVTVTGTAVVLDRPDGL